MAGVIKKDFFIESSYCRFVACAENLGPILITHCAFQLMCKWKKLSAWMYKGQIGVSGVVSVVKFSKWDNKVTCCMKYCCFVCGGGRGGGEGGGADRKELPIDSKSPGPALSQWSRKCKPHQPNINTCFMWWHSIQCVRHSRNCSWSNTQ